MSSTYKVLAQVSPAATTPTVAYTVPGSTATVCSSIVVCNRDIVGTSFRISIGVAAAVASDKQYIAYDTVINPNEVMTFNLGMTLAATDVVRVYATLPTLSFTLFGEEIS